MTPYEVPQHLPLLALVIGSVCGGIFGFCLGLEKLDRERKRNQRRREAIRRHAISRSNRSGATHKKETPKP